MPNAVTAKTRAETVLLGATLIWGGTFVISKIGLAEASPMFLIAVRFGIAALLLLAVFRSALFPISRSQLLKGGMLGLLLFLGFAAQTIGLTITTASKSAFITGMMVIGVPLLQVAIERRFPKLGNIVGVAAVAVGLWLLTSPGGGGFNFGDGLTLLCALFFAIYIVYLDVISGAMRAEQLTFLQIVTTGALALVSALAFEEIRVSWSGTFFAALGYLTLLATVATTYLQTRFQKDTTPTRAVLIFSIEPVIAALLASVFLDERLDATAVLGGGLIVAGVLVSELSDAIPILNRDLGALAGARRQGESS